MRERKNLINVVCDTNGMVEVAPHQGTATVAREAANSWGVWVQATCGARAYAALTNRISLTASSASASLGTLVAATPSLLRRIDETARCLAHVSAEQAVEVVYDEGADHLVRGRGGVDR